MFPDIKGRRGRPGQGWRSAGQQRKAVKENTGLNNFQVGLLLLLLDNITVCSVFTDIYYIIQTGAWGAGSRAERVGGGD